MMSTEERLLRGAARADNGCLLWGKARNRDGYGQVWIPTPHGPRRGDKAYAHRAAYTTWVGEIPEGLTVDHLCHNAALLRGECPGGTGCVHRRCIEPSHLGLASIADNLARGNSVNRRNRAKTACPLGHPYAGANLYVDPRGKRECRACWKVKRDRRRNATT